MYSTFSHLILLNGMLVGRQIIHIEQQCLTALDEPEAAGETHCWTMLTTVSHSIYQNVAIVKDILTFSGNVRPQVQTTKKCPVALWCTANHDPFCILHTVKCNGVC